MGKIVWRELTVAFTLWLLVLLVLNTVMRGFVELVIPLTILGWIWVANLLMWIWTKRS